ncbi:hypothetical protein ACJX0J_020920, partial [Zea mays]
SKLENIYFLDRKIIYDSSSIEMTLKRAIDSEGEGLQRTTQNFFLGTIILHVQQISLLLFAVPPTALNTHSEPSLHACDSSSSSDTEICSTIQCLIILCLLIKEDMINFSLFVYFMLA